MMDKGWNQSELARRTFGTHPHTGEAKGRDSISGYIRGRNFPDPKNLHKLAKALGVEPGELLPNTFEDAMAVESPAFEIKQAPGGDKIWLRVNRACSAKAAAQIFQILQEDDEADG